MINFLNYSLTGWQIKSLELGKQIFYFVKLSREAAIKCVKELMEVLGSQWSERVLFPKLVASLEGSIYLYRVTLLFIIQVRSEKTKLE